MKNFRRCCVRRNRVRTLRPRGTQNVRQEIERYPLLIDETFESTIGCPIPPVPNQVRDLVTSLNLFPAYLLTLIIGGKTLDGKTIATKTFIQALVVAFVALLVMAVLYAAEFFLLLFASILLAILFRAMSVWIREKTGLAGSVSTAMALLLPMILVASFIWIAAPSVSEQAAELSDRVPKAVSELRQQVRQYSWADRLLDRQDQLKDSLPDESKMINFAGRFFSSTFGALGNLVIVLALGVFLSIGSTAYFNGLLRLAPIGKRARAKEVLEATRSTLASWLVAKIIEMTLIGVLITIGLWLIGIDLALVLGIIAGLLSFIPNFGPVISIIPALLIALVGGMDDVLYVVALYAGVQTLESYVFTPILQKKMVDLPPALTVGAQVLFGYLAGALGVILATPLAAASMVMIRMWYVEDLLGDRRGENSGAVAGDG